MSWYTSHWWCIYQRFNSKEPFLGITLQANEGGKLWIMSTSFILQLKKYWSTALPRYSVFPKILLKIAKNITNLPQNLIRTIEEHKIYPWFASAVFYSQLWVGCSTTTYSLNIKNKDKCRMAPTRKLKPSQRYPLCWTIKKKALSDRRHTCDCGCTMPRDAANGWVMIKWALGD